MAAYTIVYNPNADSDSGFKKSQVLLKKLEGNELQFQDITLITDYPSFFAKLSPETRVVICGGDGTLNRFINDTDGLNIPNDIYYYACGCGNDFCADLDKREGCDPFLINPYIENLPTVEVNGKTYKFLNNVGFGIDGYCCEVGDQMRANGEKNINYASIAIKGMLGGFKPVNAIVTVDGEVHEFKKAWLAPTMNGRFYGGGMMATPDQQRLDSAKTLSVMIMHGAGKIRTLIVFPSIFKGQHLTHKDMATVLTGHDITVEFDKPTALQIDGETILGVTKYHAVKN